ncbi:hypothetical protein KKC60_03730, partial [Patescibacteria group bacterium]|nr:hypothetical protein [Patescibacteria group bacterium]
MSFVDLLTIILLLSEIFLSILILSKGLGRLVNKALGLLTFTLVGWGGAILMAKNYESVLAAELAFAFGSILIFSFFLFSLVYPKRKKLNSKYYLFLVPTVIFVVLSFIKGAVFDGVAVVDGVLVTTRGPWYSLFVIYVIGYFFSSLIILFRRHRRAKGSLKLQFKYFLVGLFLFATPALLSNVILPVFDIFYLNTVGPAFSIFFVFFTAYAIFRYRLMDIRVVFRESFVYAAAAGTVIGAGLLIMYLNEKFLVEFVPQSVAGVFALLLGSFSFNYLKNAYLKLANKYLFAGLYDSRLMVRRLIKRITASIEISEIVLAVFKIIKEVFEANKAELVIFQRENTRRDTFLPEEGQGFDLSEEEIDQIKEGSYNFSETVLLFEEIKEKARKKKTLLGLVEVLDKNKASVLVLFVRKKKLIGFVLIGARENSNAYTKEDLDMLGLLADQSSLAFENALLYSEV